MNGELVRLVEQVLSEIEYIPQTPSRDWGDVQRTGKFITSMSPNKPVVSDYEDRRRDPERYRPGEVEDRSKESLRDSAERSFRMVVAKKVNKWNNKLDMTDDEIQEEYNKVLEKMAEADKKDAEENAYFAKTPNVYHRMVTYKTLADRARHTGESLKKKNNPNGEYFLALANFYDRRDSDPKNELSSLRVGKI